MTTKEISEMSVEELERALEMARKSAAEAAARAKEESARTALPALRALADAQKVADEAREALRATLATFAGAGGAPDEIRALLDREAPEEAVHLATLATMNGPAGWARKRAKAGEGTHENGPYHYVRSYVSSVAKKAGKALKGSGVYGRATQAAKDLGLPQMGDRDTIPETLRQEISRWVSAAPSA
jgi:membrane protein involved in colicin uptake